jgi:hypothetical protein
VAGRLRPLALTDRALGTCVNHLKLMDHRLVDRNELHGQSVYMAATDRLDTSAVAELAGVKPASIHRQRLRGTVPEPDGYLGRTPWWYRRTIERWLATRPPAHRPASKSSKLSRPATSQKARDPK